MNNHILAFLLPFSYFSPLCESSGGYFVHQKYQNQYVWLIKVVTQEGLSIETQEIVFTKYGYVQILVSSLCRYLFTTKHEHVGVWRLALVRYLFSKLTVPVTHAILSNPLLEIWDDRISAYLAYLHVFHHYVRAVGGILYIKSTKTDMYG